jgi:hypothetical protein
MINKFINILGWTGSISILSAYGMSTHNLTKNKKLIDMMNIYGAFTVGLICYKKKAWQPFILETAWFGIACSSLYKSYENKIEK